MNVIVSTTAATETQRASPKKWKQRIPNKAPPRCPPNKARGWAASDSLKAKRNTVDPPREASKKGERTSSTSQRATAIAPVAPMTDQKRSRIFLRIPVAISSLILFQKTVLKK
jgi:hypothetical protein